MTQITRFIPATLLNFFKVNDPFRLLGILVYMAVFSVISLIFFSFPTTIPTLLWMVLGERLSEGYSLYVDVVDDTGPLSAGVFTGLHLLFGRSEFVYLLLGRMLAFFQIFYWNRTLIKYRVFDENTYLPAIIMAALFHFSFDLMTLSPTLLGSTFLMLALGQLFSHTVLQKESSESTLLIGLFGGLATAFHWNFVFFLPFLIFTGLAISNFTIRQLFLSIMGFIVPLLLILVFYFWNDGLLQALSFLPLLLAYPKYAYHDYLTWLPPGSLALVLAVAGFFIGSFFRGATINQQKQRQLVLSWLLFSAGLFFLVKTRASYQLVVFIPGLTYLITQFFLYFNWNLVLRPLFFAFTLAVPLWGMTYWNARTTIDRNYFVPSTSEVAASTTSQVMVVGADCSPYLSATLGGPFLNYQMSKSYLSQEKTLQQKAQLFQMLRQQIPERVLDQEGLFSQLLEELPALKEYYIEASPGVYTKK